MPSPSPDALASSQARAPTEDELREQVLGEIRRILADELELSARAEPDMALVADLRMDSMELLSLAVGLENRFRVKLSEADTAGVSTVGDLTKLVARRVLAAPVPPPAEQSKP